MDRLLTPNGLPLYGAKEFAAAVAKKETLPDHLAILDATHADVKAGPKGSRRFKFRISTQGIDRDRDIISVAGWNLDHYKKNPVVLYAHDYHALPVGKSVDIQVGKAGLDAEMEFVDPADYPFAGTIMNMVNNGILRAASVGFKPLKYMYNEERRGVDIDQAELLEWSIVPVPANPECLIQLSAVPLGAALDFASSCEQFLTQIKGKGQWVVGADLKKDPAADLDALAQAVIKEITGKVHLQGVDKSYPGCKREGGCPTNHDGSPDNCSMADCPLKPNTPGVGQQAAARETVEKDDEFVFEDEDQYCHGITPDHCKELVDEAISQHVTGAVKEAVRAQIRYHLGLID